MAVGSATSGFPRRLRLLVVDDNTADIDLLQLTFQPRGGADFSLVRDGNSALQQSSRVELNAFDLILIDWRLPGVGGDVVAKAYRRTLAGLDVPIILLSSAVPPSLIEELREQEVTVLEKPLDLDGYSELVNRLEALATHRSLTRCAAK